MKTLGTIIIIPIVFILEIVCIICTISLYTILTDGEFVTKELIDKL